MIRQKNRLLEIGNQNEVYYLQPKSILYVVADGNYCDIHLVDGDVLKTVSCKRAEIARKIDFQLAGDLARMFSLVGKPYLVNICHIMHIAPMKHLLTFDTNHPGTCRKKTIDASPEALRSLRSALDDQSIGKSAGKTERLVTGINGGFSDYVASTLREETKNYDIGDDEIMMLGL